MEKYFAITVDKQYYDVWNGEKTDNFIYARLYDTITDLKNDGSDLTGYEIKELVIDNEYNLISEKYL